MPRPTYTYNAATVNTRTAGKPEYQELLEKLAANYPQNEFFHSLHQQLLKFGGLTVRQWTALIAASSKWPLPEESRVPKRPATTAPAKPQAARPADFDGTAIMELFNTAKQHLHYPRITLTGIEGIPYGKLMLYLSVKSPQYANCVLITNAARDLDKRIYAVINTKGKGYINTASMQTLSKEDAEAVCMQILLIAENPVNYSKVTGQKYGHCCFCGLELTNASSVHHGYGPICAEKWGLPWGDRPDDKKKEAQELPDIDNIAGDI